MRWLLRCVVLGLIGGMVILQGAMVLGHANSGDEVGLIALERTGGSWYYRLTLVDTNTNVTYPLVYRSGRQGSIGWSPDGTQVALTQTIDGEPDLVLLDVTTRQTHAAHTNLAPLTPAWSPDGAHIAFLANDDDDRGDIFLYTVANDETINLTHSADVDETRFAWSPDSARLAYTSGAQLWLMSLDGDARLLPITVSDVPILPQWSPDGRFLAVLERQSGLPTVLEVATGLSQQIDACAAPIADSFAWYPDGRLTCPIFADMTHTSGIRRINVLTQEEDVIALDDEAVYRLAWSADGRMLTYYRVQQRDRLIVATYDASAQRLTPVAEHPESATTAWRPSDGL